MKLLGLIDLSLILILASHSKGQKWEIDVDRHINATIGSEVIIQCNFTIPPIYDTENLEVYWKKMVKSNFDTGDKHDQNAFVYHKNETFVLEKYRGKTSLIGDIKKRNCTLKIRNIEARDQDIYVRVIAKDAYSFREFPTTIYVNGHRPVTPILDNANSSINESSTGEITEMPLTTTTTTTTIYIAIFVPVAALLLIILITGIIFWRKRRSKPIARQDSGYYANFRRASSNQAKRDESCKKQDTQKLPESKNIDEPVYINFEVPLGQMHQNNDQTDSVYANVDYSQ
ncbi:uncharacterized protein LOC104932371 isoform X2 [Larimichthys crocea]|uniref:uncharacterized protein LOC104932371 isoform X2 n=1 Tax=Larimichthys crocea TaxID=215358 RepID=UPI000F5FE1D8|nr:uncharacterized protein LOC104932371 isoform X2 [Larimichthys crocea]